MEFQLDKKTKEEILAKAASIKAEKGISGRIFPIVVEARPDEERLFYVGYFKEPNMKAMSKFIAMSKNDELKGLHVLATELMISGDRELIDDECLFLSGTMQTISQLMGSRQAVVVGL
ncbi:MAG: hypothetical protein ACRDD8_15490 [Bacteroidales bacterium]